MAEMSKHDQMFTQLIMTFQSAAWIQLGKVKNPQTQKVERDLTQAQYSIDMLDMLQEKTKGNISPDQAKMLTNILTNLKLNYVEELEKEKTGQKSEQNDAEHPPESK